MKISTILALNNKRVRKYFLEEDKYINFDLPPYFTFKNIIKDMAKTLKDKRIDDLFATKEGIRLKPQNFENVNYLLFNNKDGEFAWRPFEVIHPALYVALVYEITSEKSWNFLKNRFKDFAASGVVCESLPIAYDRREGQNAMQIKRWWSNIEQRSLQMSLSYQYVFDVDITDCYGSIYTHSIAWALHGRDAMKNEKGNKKFLGDRIDRLIRMMRYGQTNGIPQGSTLMDFIAEIILGYIDLRLMAKLSENEKSSCKILRYRDDYKIFTDNPEFGKIVVKKLSEVIASLGMKLNTQKTKLQTDIVMASVKKDKIYELSMSKNKTTLSKDLLRIYAASSKFPNSGMIVRLLDNYYKVLRKRKRLGKFDNIEAMVGIATNIAVKNPRTYNLSTAILSKLLEFYKSKKQKKDLINKLQKKFLQVPNTSLFDVWLQRISYNIDPTIKYKEKLTKLDKLKKDAGNTLWESSWLKQNVRAELNTSVIDKNKLKCLSSIVSLKEIELFKSLRY
jgi:hypothetical protein